ncbi:MAG: hypothetical protein C5B50_05625 [Verrucomicrobia bacterium]|nr:MAG: hypothetical protein C5B50_05625 [Verrucomicrobiota bacterium]
MVDHPKYFTVTAEDCTPINTLSIESSDAGVQSLIQQQIFGRKSEIQPARLSQLLELFGCGWEGLTEPGHMSFVGYSSFVLGQAMKNSEDVANAICRELDVPVVKVEGVSVVDVSSPVMSNYSRLISTHPGLYGDSPYVVNTTDQTCVLRQTACFQKYSACLNRPLPVDSLPLALFEVSDSFRREPKPALQLGFRLRRFHLPEAHIHTRTVEEAVNLSLRFHPLILSTLSEMEAPIVLLISATDEFARSHEEYFKTLCKDSSARALLKVSPPGELCEDGVEVDVEYHIVDSTGCCRELSTFQIDRRITETFGISCSDKTTPATIHAVFTGGVERFLYFCFDRIIRRESQGISSHLPLWLSPVILRIWPENITVLPLALQMAEYLSREGIRTEVDDRGLQFEVALQDSEALLVPYFVRVDANKPSDCQTTSMQRFGERSFIRFDMPDFIRNTKGLCSRHNAIGFSRLSRQLFNTLRK